MAGYDQERSWLAELGAPKTLDRCKLMGLIGLQEQELSYYLDMARRRLKSLGRELELSQPLYAGSGEALLEMSSMQTDLFTGPSWRVVFSLEKVEQKEVPLWQALFASTPIEGLILVGAPSWKQEWWEPFWEGIFTIDLRMEKPWERPRRLAPWVQHCAASLGLEITLYEAQKVVQLLAGDRYSIKSELERLAAYHGYQGRIASDEVSGGSENSVNLWVEAMIQSDAPRALAQIEGMLLSDPSGLLAVAAAGYQWRSALRWSQKIAARYPASKKQQELATSRSLDALFQGIVAISTAQYDLKNGRSGEEVLAKLVLQLINPVPTFESSDEGRRLWEN